MGILFSEIASFFRRQSVLSLLLIINLLVFLLIKLVGVVFLLFNFSPDSFTAFFELPSALGQLAHRPWTAVSYMFTHFDFWHIVFNLLCLYWFGQIFLRFFGPKQLCGLYIMGGLAGGLLFVLSYNVFPYFGDSVSHSRLVGASASTMAIIFASAFYRRGLKISLILLGSVRLLYIALGFLAVDLLSIEHDNPGGHIAHIGGAAMGVCFARLAAGGWDLTAGINFVFDRIANLFAKKRRPRKRVHRRPETDYEYNKRKYDEQVEIDRILDKIKHSGYNSLSENEKRKLFNASK